MRAELLAWYDRVARRLPWRIRPEDRAAGVIADPYAIWLSEVMSQQTTLAHATPYWEKFLARFPTVDDLANAPREEVLAMWAGLGYYARARNLHKCAGVVRDEFGGVFPITEAALLKLPGIGPYTAATIAAICADEATNIVDGNVERVISRIFAVESELPKAKPELRALAQTLIRDDRPGDYGQALMDLGATLCTPTSPDCPTCPWQAYCAAFTAGNATEYPKKTKKVKTPIRHGAVYILRHNGAVLVEQRPDKGLLGGMLGLPTTPWAASKPNDHSHAPMLRNWEHLGDVTHVFTHFELRLRVYGAQATERGEGLWREDVSGLPTVFAKAFRVSR